MNIETDRLYITPTTSKDLEDIYEILSNPRTMTFFTEGTYDKEQITNLIQQNKHKIEHYSLILKETGKTIGKVSFHPWFMNQTYEIGWIMNESYTNQGYMSEATKAIVDYGFKTLQLHRIIATCQPENIPSKRLCEKLGMRLEGTFIQCIHVKEDIWWDELFYAILKEDYQKK